VLLIVPEGLPTNTAVDLEECILNVDEKQKIRKYPTHFFKRGRKKKTLGGSTILMATGQQSAGEGT